MIGRSIIMTLLLPILSSSKQTSVKDFSVIMDPSKLLETQKYLIEDMENILYKNNKTLSVEQLELLKKELNRNKQEYEDAREENDQYFDNLINRVVLIKRLSIDLDLIIKQNVGLKKNSSLLYPDYKDLEVSVSALAGLQQFYRLDVTELAEGMLNTNFTADGEIFTAFFSPLTASDRFVIGEVMNKNNLYKEGIPWLLEAARLYEKESKINNHNMAHIITAICKGYDALGDHKNYIDWVQKLISLKLPHSIELENKMNAYSKHLLKSLNKREHKLQTGKKKETRSRNQIDLENPCTKIKVTKTFEMLCRGELLVNPDVSKRLKCWYSVGHHPVSILAPFKVEQLFIQPDLILIHNMLSDSEIDTITRYADTQYVIKSEVLYDKPIVYPFLKITALNEVQLKTVEIITQRVSDFTELKVEDSQWVVSKYTAGGHYNMHVDSSAYNPYITRSLKKYNLTNPLTEHANNMIIKYFEQQKILCREASLLIYLSDVEQGGATVFSLLGVTVFPEKGAALYWANLLPSGDIDYALCHGACPVLYGSKTIAQKWFIYENQVLTCPLTEIRREIRDIPPPILKN